MSDDTTGKASAAEPATDWRRLRGMSDDEVHAAVLDDPDAKPTDEAFWEDARVVSPRSRRGETKRPTTKSLKERQEDIENYIAARQWYRQKVREGTATDGDLAKLERCRDLAVEARRSGVTAPAFE